MDGTGIDWSNITSTGALIMTLLYGITKAIPNMIQAFQDEQAELRKDHRKAMELTNERSERIALSGHETVGKLSESVGRVADEVATLREHAVNNPCRATE
jgi:hypothetical protein